MLGLAEITGAYVDLQQVFLARAARDLLLACDELARDERKQVAGLLVRIDPLGKVAPAFQVA